MIRVSIVFHFHFLHSFLLNFAYAEALELRGSIPEVHIVFDKLLSVLAADLERLAPPPAPVSPTVPEEPLNDSQESQNSTGSQDIEPDSELVERKREYGIVYIMYMRFGRRAEGQKSARTIFARARKDKWTPWEVYEAAGQFLDLQSFSILLTFFLPPPFNLHSTALMEYHTSDDKAVPGRIFEKGLETHAGEIQYVERYLGYLISVNDHNSQCLMFHSFALTNLFSTPHL